MLNESFHPHARKFSTGQLTVEVRAPRLPCAMPPSTRAPLVQSACLSARPACPQVGWFMNHANSRPDALHAGRMGVKYGGTQPTPHASFTA